MVKHLHNLLYLLKYLLCTLWKIMEWLVTEDGKYKIVSLSAATFHGALRVITESFCRDEAIAIGTEVYKDELAVEELLELCASTALDGVSVVAVHIESGEVAAVAFNKLRVVTSFSEKPFLETFDKDRCKQPSSRGLIEFMASVDTKINLYEKLGLDCSFEIKFLGTLGHHRYKKLATHLCKISLEIAKKLKDGPVSVVTVKDLGSKYSFMPERKPVDQVPKFVHAMWTSIESQKIGKALGFDVHLRAPLSDFYFDGKSYSERTGMHIYIEVVAFLLK